MPTPRPRQPRLRVRQLPSRPPTRRRHPSLRTPSRFLRWIVLPARSVRQWYQSVDWGRHTAVLAAVVAAVSLAVSAWGTWKSAQVADDQLTQSRAQHEAAERAQASLVSFWPEGDKLVIANRSYDSAGVALAYGGIFSPGSLALIPPCKQLTVPRTGRAALPLELFIQDASGAVWERNETGQLALYLPAGNTWHEVARPPVSVSKRDTSGRSLTEAKGCG